MVCYSILLLPSPIAQRQSTRLLIEGLLVRIQLGELTKALVPHCGAGGFLVNELTSQELAQADAEILGDKGKVVKSGWNVSASACRHAGLCHAKNLCNVSLGITKPCSPRPNFCSSSFVDCHSGFSVCYRHAFSLDGERQKSNHKVRKSLRRV